MPLVAIAREFSPRYECHGDDLISIDVRGLERLLGTPRQIGEEMRRDAAGRDIRAHVAVAGTRTAALVLAIARPGLTVVERGAEASALASLPLDMLSAPAATLSRRQGDPNDEAESTLAALQRWGLKTFGELAALPPADLRARLGSSALFYQAIARGEDIRPLVPAVADERFEASLDLEWPIDGLEPLSFVLTRLLEPLSTRLERRDRGVAVLHVELQLVTRDLYARHLELPSPLRDVRTLRTLALLDLESHPPPAAIDRVSVVVDPTPGRIVQHTLFVRPHPTPEQLSTLLARLGALMGVDRLGAPAVVDTHRPGAFEMKPFAMDHESDRGDPRPSDVSAGSTGAAMASALRRCRQPVPARVVVDEGRPIRVTSDRRGFAGGAVVQAAGPWRTSGNWWEAPAAMPSAGLNSRSDGPPAVEQKSTPWDRDEWDVALNDGGVYRIFRDRSTEAWFIDGIVD